MLSSAPALELACDQERAFARDQLSETRRRGCAHVRCAPRSLPFGGAVKRALIRPGSRVRLSERRRSPADVVPFAPNRPTREHAHTGMGVVQEQIRGKSEIAEDFSRRRGGGRERREEKVSRHGAKRNVTTQREDERAGNRESPCEKIECCRRSLAISDSRSAFILRLLAIPYSLLAPPCMTPIPDACLQELGGFSGNGCSVPRRSCRRGIAAVRNRLRRHILTAPVVTTSCSSDIPLPC